MQWYFILLIVISSLFLLITITLLVVGLVVCKYTFSREMVFPGEEKEVWHVINEQFYKDSTNKERIEIKSHDNLNLVGYLYKNTGHKYIVFVHGYHGVYYEQSYMASFMYEKGYNCLMITHRAHGESDGKFCSMGYKEANDLSLWIKKINEIDKDAEIAIFGWSMGAATVLMSTTKNLPSNVKVLVCDCGYTSIYDEIKFISKTQVLHNHKILLNISMFATQLSAFLFLKIRMKKNNPIEAVKTNKIPTLFIHGEVDRFVNDQFVFELYNNAICDKKLKIFKTTKHCASLRDNSAEYLDLVYNFIDEKMRS